MPSLLKIAISVAFMGASLCAQAVAQAGPQDQPYGDALENRTEGRPVVHLFGDSIFRGWALKKFPDQYTEEEAEEDLLWPLRSPVSMLRMVSDRAYDVGYGGGTGLPTASTGAVLQRMLSGDIHDGDIVVLEDAGDHSKDPMAFYLLLMDLRVTLCQKDIDVIFLNTYDDIPPGALTADWGIEDEDIFRWSVPFDGMTMNDSFAKAARAKIVDCKQPYLIDVHGLLRDVKNREHVVVHEDGIHPTITGQWAISLALDKKVEEILSERGAE